MKKKGQRERQRDSKLSWHGTSWARLGAERKELHPGLEAGRGTYMQIGGRHENEEREQIEGLVCVLCVWR